MKSAYVTAGVALGVVGLGVLLYRKFDQAIPDGTLNPAADNNIVNRTVERVGKDITGNKDWSLGVALWEWANGESEAALLAGQSVPKKGEVYK